MKVVILNSGMGTRMGSLTKEHPKCMTEISETETILSAQLKNVVKAGIQDVVITTGYFNDVLVEYCASLNLPLNIEYVFNPLFDKTNYIYSIYCAKQTLKDQDIVLMHGDMVVDEKVFKAIASSSHSCMAVSTTLPLPEKDFKAVIRKDKILAVGINFFENAVAAQPLYKLMRQDWNAWLDQIEVYVNRKETSCYAENAFNDISENVAVNIYDVKDALCNEIDNYEDLCVIAKRYQDLIK
jgi:phosphoenolpyruvate phosphomutase